MSTWTTREPAIWGPFCVRCGHPSSRHGVSFCMVVVGASSSTRDCDCDGYRPYEAGVSPPEPEPEEPEQEPQHGFHLHIATDNAAFDDNPATEVGRILYKVVQDLPRFGVGYDFEVLLDSNGNRVGFWRYTPHPEDEREDGQ